MPTHLPRVSVIITEEQRALLSELVSLDPETRSVGGYIRDLVDEVTPLLRVMVPAMRAASQELDNSREQLREPLRQFAQKLDQLDLLGTGSAAPRARPEHSEDGRTERRTRARKTDR